MKVELTDIVFAIDSILVAVAMSQKIWVILAGGLLGIVMMRVVIGKLLSFHSEHATELKALRHDLEVAAEQLPPKQRAIEAEPLQQQLDALAKRRGVQPLAAIIPLVLARLAGRVVQSRPSESAGP